MPKTTALRGPPVLCAKIHHNDIEFAANSMSPWISTVCRRKYRERSAEKSFYRVHEEDHEVRVSCAHRRSATRPRHVRIA